MYIDSAEFMIELFQLYDVNVLIDNSKIDIIETAGVCFQ